MFDFRYHALSLAGVFLALVVGLLLGVAIGDKELVSSAREDIRDSLRNDVRRADTERDAAKAQLAAEQAYGEKAYPILTDGRLRGRNIGLVSLGQTDVSPDTVQKWLDPSGASLSLVAELKDDVDTKALAERARGLRYDRVGDDPELVTPLGRRAGIQMVQGGKLIGQLRTALLQSTSGEFGGLDGVIVARPSKQPKNKQEAERLVRPAGRHRARARPDGREGRRDRVKRCRSVADRLVSRSRAVDRRQHRRDRGACGARVRPGGRGRRVRAPRRRAGPAAARRRDRAPRTLIAAGPKHIRRLRLRDRAACVSVRRRR